MNEDEKWYIERLSSRDVSEADVSSCIDTLEMLLSLDALMPLVSLIGDSSRSLEIRQRAAIAISRIGPSYVRQELDKLKSIGSPETGALVEMALKQ